MKLQATIVCACSVSALTLGPVVGITLAAEPPNWQFSSSITYESGHFGTGTRTETVYVPFTLKRLFDQGDIGLTLPFVTVRTAGETTLVEGTLQKIRKGPKAPVTRRDRKSTRLNSSHLVISYAVFCLKKKKKSTDQS